MRLTRRNILAGTAAVAGASVLPSAAMAAPEPSQVVALIARYRAAINEQWAADEREEELYLKARHELPERPARLCMRRRGFQSELLSPEPLTAEQINAWYDSLDSNFGASAQHRAARDSMLADLAAYDASCDEVLRRYGWHEVKARADALVAETWRLIEEIKTTPSRTIVDVLAKMRFADEFDSFTETAAEPDNTYVTPIMLASVLADLERVAGGPRP